VESQQRGRLPSPDGAEEDVEVVDELGRDLTEQLLLEAVRQLLDESPVVQESGRGATEMLDVLKPWAERAPTVLAAGATLPRSTSATNALSAFWGSRLAPRNDLDQ
jgi:hypothetical protein